MFLKEKNSLNKSSCRLFILGFERIQYKAEQIQASDDNHGHCIIIVYSNMSVDRGRQHDRRGWLGSIEENALVGTILMLLLSMCRTRLSC